MMANAHAVVFAEKIAPDNERFDFALVAVDGDDILSYVQCREIDARTLYWGHGGSFPGTKGTTRSWEVYQAFTAYCWMKYYNRIFTYIENTNAVMLKFAAKMGYLIVGVRNVNGSIFLEHMLDGT